MTLDELKRLAEAAVAAQQAYLDAKLDMVKGLEHQVAAGKLRDALPPDRLLKLLEMIAVLEPALRREAGESWEGSRASIAIKRFDEIERSL